MAASVRDVQNLVTTVVGLQGNPVSANVPAVGDVLVWNGIEWEPAAVGGGGVQPPFGPPEMTATTGVNQTFVLQDQPTINQPIVMGVVDGTQAGPGQIGEFLLNDTSVIVDAASFDISSGATDIVGSIPLTGGEWELLGWFSMEFLVQASSSVMDGFMQFDAPGILQTNFFPQMQFQGAGSYNLLASLLFGPIRFYTIDPWTVTLGVAKNLRPNDITGGSGSYYTSMRARRIH